MDLFSLVTISCFVSVTAQSSSNSGYFWHVTDLHYDPSYWTNQLSCLENVTNPGLFGDEWCDSNWRLITSAIHAMAAIKSDVDFLIWTGDSVAHIADNKTTLKKNVEILKNITSLLNDSFPGVQTFPSLGNHDFSPSDQANYRNDSFYTETAGVWKTWIPDDQQLDQFMKGGFYSMLMPNKQRLMSLNTNLYYDKNKLTKGMADPAGQFAWMESVLDRARTNGEKVIAIAHVTPGVLTPNFTTWMYPDHQEKYVSILTSYSDVIQASHYGHDHSDGFKIMQNKDNSSKAVPQFVAPSVTPWRFKAGALVGSHHNPGIRLVQFDRNTGDHLNYVQYFLDLDLANARNVTKWTKLYDFRETYGVPNMGVESLRQIFDRMKMKGGDATTMAQMYCNNALVVKANTPCSTRNGYEIICGGIHYNYEEAKKCVDHLAFGGGQKKFPVMFNCIFAVLACFLIRNYFLL